MLLAFVRRLAAVTSLYTLVVHFASPLPAICCGSIVEGVASLQQLIALVVAISGAVHRLARCGATRRREADSGD